MGRERPERRETCQWTYVELDGYYATECGQTFCYHDGTRIENGAHYCHHCGGAIAERRECCECDAEIPVDGGSDLCAKCAEDDDA